MPVFYWRERVAPPKLHISKLTSNFVLYVGHLNLTFNDECSCAKLDTESSESSSYKSILEPAPADKAKVEVEIFSRMNTTGTIELNLPDPNKFPLLLPLGYNPMNMDCLIQEILFFLWGQSNNFMHDYFKSMQHTG